MKRNILLAVIISLCVLFAAPFYAGNAAQKPAIIKLGSMADKYEAVRFDHEKHTLLAGNCGMCHHEHGNSGALPCKDCHSVTPSAFKSSVTRNFMACKNCHAAYNPLAPNIPGLKSAYHRACFQCHRGMGNVGLDPKGCAEMCHTKKEQKINVKIQK